MVRIVKLGQSAKRSSPVPGQGGKGSYSGRHTSAGSGQAESWDFLSASVCGQIYFARFFCVCKVSQHPLVHLEGWMTSGQVFCCVPVP